MVKRDTQCVYHIGEQLVLKDRAGGKHAYKLFALFQCFLDPNQHVQSQLKVEILDRAYLHFEVGVCALGKAAEILFPDLRYSLADLHIPEGEEFRRLEIDQIDIGIEICICFSHDLPPYLYYCECQLIYL